MYLPVHARNSDVELAFKTLFQCFEVWVAVRRGPQPVLRSVGVAFETSIQRFSVKRVYISHN